ncbi:hypothetical protein EHV15_34590 [Paenibacillus oralis]|uniref:Uncharacterized protein n=1 Tax=Paenibacillus oralis TaxID=2490856 RepID=A0A3P3TCA2_9BACL|nr:hypothetical protein [Paenibacillus oralis]RRJ54728.1 hypothetical protein EHV15_34590 [Paenibacillus oralis]
MQTVFLNKLQQVDTKKKESGNVIIKESEGRWIAGWSTKGPDKIEETWYDGESWEDLLAAFRKGVAEKFSQGFKPELEMQPQLQILSRCYRHTTSQ